MITGRNFAEGYYEDERLYSTGYDELDDILERAFCEGYEYAQREFGGKSKMLGLVSGGAWQAKEAAKYGYDNEEDYKKDRAKYAAKGFFTPITATYIKKQCERMAEEGASPEEIREYLEMKGKHADKKTKRMIAGIAEAFVGFGVPGNPVAAGVALHDVISKDRKKFDKK